MTSTLEPKVHIGRNIKRIREIFNVKQETLANGLGVSQQMVSKLEDQSDIEDEKLEKIANIIGVTSSAIKNLNEDALLGSVINNNFSDHAVAVQQSYSNNDTATQNYQFNSVEKVTELYERLLQNEREKVKDLAARLDALERKK